MAAVTTVSFLRAAPNTQVADDSAGASEVITPAAANTASTVISTAELNIVRIGTNRDIMVSIGEAPDATSDADRFLLPAGQLEWRGVRSGRKVAVALA